MTHPPDSDPRKKYDQHEQEKERRELHEELKKLVEHPLFKSINISARQLAGGHIEVTLLGDPRVVMDLGPIGMYMGVHEALHALWLRLNPGQAPTPPPTPENP